MTATLSSVERRIGGFDSPAMSDERAEHEIGQINSVAYNYALFGTGGIALAMAGVGSAGAAAWANAIVLLLSAVTAFTERRLSASLGQDAVRRGAVLTLRNVAWSAIFLGTLVAVVLRHPEGVPFDGASSLAIGGACCVAVTFVSAILGNRGARSHHELADDD